jgi:hypothetical protein
MHAILERENSEGLGPLVDALDRQLVYVRCPKPGGGAGKKNTGLCASGSPTWMLSQASAYPSSHSIKDRGRPESQWQPLRGDVLGYNYYGVGSL